MQPSRCRAANALSACESKLNFDLGVDIPLAVLTAKIWAASCQVV
jgi:hypothetical protein